MTQRQSRCLYDQFLGATLSSANIAIHARTNPFSGVPPMWRFSVFLLVVAGTPLLAAEKAAPIDRAWYSPQELLVFLAQRDGIQWALPETLTGRALVGGDSATTEALLDQACKQWGLSWIKANGVVVVHRADNDRLQTWVNALQRGDGQSINAAWELGWLRDGRALPALADALASKVIAVALAAAQAIETLDTTIPLGRTDRVEPLQPGRVSLAAAFPPKADLTTLLASDYPPLRAAALRLLLSQGGKM